MKESSLLQKNANLNVKRNISFKKYNFEIPNKIIQVRIINKDKILCEKQTYNWIAHDVKVSSNKS